MTCCENPIDLGCVGSCSNVMTGHTINAGDLENFKLKADFNGTLHCVTLLEDSDNELYFEASKLNEDYFYTLHLYESGEQIKCFTVKIYPEICK